MTAFLRTVHLLCATLFSLAATTPAQAESGPLRQRIQERLAERRQAHQEAQTSPDREPGTRNNALAPGHHNGVLQHDGLKRIYRVYVPASRDPAKPAALLVALHGGGGNMDYQADDARYGLVSKADREGLVVVFPNGYSRFGGGKLATWNAGRCCGAARDQAIDDVGFIRALVARIAKQANIDRKRVYATGMSNGGMMAYRLACELPDVFTAIAAVAGTDNTAACTSAGPVSVLHIHAKNDTHVLFEGGSGMDAHQAAVTDFSSVAGTIEKWTRLDACPAIPQRVLQKNGAYCDLYAPCRGGTQVKLCVTETGGHSWPGAAKTRHEPASQAISANDMMWDFFSREYGK